jgi:hypothetical protein
MIEPVIDVPLTDREIVRELARDCVTIDRIDVVARTPNGSAVRYRCRNVKGITLGQLLDAAEMTTA